MAALAAASAADAHDCHCRYYGETYQQGEIVCMRGKIAQCGMYLNNSSWQERADVCPQAGVADPRLIAISPVPLVR